MDREAATFKNVTGTLKKVTFTAVLNDTATETGRMWLKRSGRTLIMRTDIDQPDPRSIGIEDTHAEIYYPKINTVQIYDLGKERALVDQFLLLGFGSPGKDLPQAYNVKLAGEETVGGVRASKLELIPKNPKVLDQIRKVELWIPPDSGHPVQQRFMQPGGDYYMVTYSDLKLNGALPDTAFRLQLPAGVKKEYPQK